MNSKLILLALGGCGFAARCSSTPSPPSVNITLTPWLGASNTPISIHGQLTMDFGVKRNDTLVVLPLEIAGQPTAQYDDQSLTATDARGELPLTTSDGVGPQNLPTRFWIASRKVHAPVTVTFTARPRDVQANTKMGPLLDIRENAGGIMGSMWALLPVPADETAQFQFALSWDLSATPKGTRAAWTWGEGHGPVSVTGTTSTLVQTFFAVGGVSSYPPPSPTNMNGRFGMYWLEQPPFNISELASFIQDYFGYASAFWQDDGTQPYRVFIRRNANFGTGGTALLRSFAFGWHDQNSTSLKDTELLLAHEITHNWPIMVGTGPDESRYMEGMAEYYSLRVLLRAGLIDASRFLDEMNRRATAYYQNPFVNASDSAAQELAWQEPAAQRIAYGRGLVYLTNVDAQVRARYNGTKSLDDLALDMLAVCRSSSADCTPEGWLAVLVKYLGTAAVDEYQAVASGHPLIRPQNESLGPCYNVVKSSTTPVVWTWELREGADPESAVCKI